MDKAKIMVVEDEGIVAHDIAGQLTDMGYDVVAIVYSGEEAVEKARELHPDLVLMDIVLAGKMDGIEAADIIRSRWDIPVVFLTAYADQKRLDRAKLVYPFGYILKPFQRNCLKVAVEIALYISKVDREKRKAEEALRRVCDELEHRVAERTEELRQANEELQTEITERNQLEEEKRILRERLQQADKMEAIGTLAGGIAHDFNNLLMGIQGHASLTLLDLDPSHPHYERLKRIEEQVESGADLTRQLLGFARGGRYDVKPADMNDIIKERSEEHTSELQSPY